MERRVNLTVGLFLVLGILALGYLSIKLGRVSFLGSSGYVVTVDFPSVGGLKAGSAVDDTIAQVAPIVPYLLLVIILIVRPMGLMGTRES